MDNFNSFTNWLVAQLQRQGWSARELARRGGISHTWVNRVMRGEEPSWDFCAKIATPLQTSPVELLIRAGKLSEQDILAIVPSILAKGQAYPAEQLTAKARLLSEADQLTLLRLAEGMAQVPKG